MHAQHARPATCGAIPMIMASVYLVLQELPEPRLCGMLVSRVQDSKVFCLLLPLEGFSCGCGCTR